MSIIDDLLNQAIPEGHGGMSLADFAEFCKKKMEAEMEKTEYRFVETGSFTVTLNNTKELPVLEGREIHTGQYTSDQSGNQMEIVSSWFVIGHNDGENGAITLHIENHHIDEELSPIGNARKNIITYLEKNPHMVDLIDFVLSADPDNPLPPAVFQLDTAEEAVKYFTSILDCMSTPVVPVIAFPAEETLEVMSNPNIYGFFEHPKPKIIPAGKQNILTI